ncbi:MAG: 30S ribosomal protein S8 [bacterium]|nr:30S ribosomal protein S8 [bacterium]
MTDPIADMLTQIRNAFAVGKAGVILPYSKFKHQLGEILAREGFIEEVSVATRGSEKTLSFKLKYLNSKPVLTNVVRVSKPGQRIYSGSTELPRTQSGFGVTIVSTSKGLLTDKQARKQNLGGEVICQIW